MTNHKCPSAQPEKCSSRKMSNYLRNHSLTCYKLKLLTSFHFTSVGPGGGSLLFLFYLNSQSREFVLFTFRFDIRVVQQNYILFSCNIKKSSPQWSQSFLTSCEFVASVRQGLCDVNGCVRKYEVKSYILCVK